MKTILVTGGTGYIGSHGVVSLIEKGYKVVIIDNLSNSNISTLENIEKITGEKPVFYNIDLRNYNETEKVFKENQIDSVIHFAGYKAVGESCEKPFDYYKNNIIGSINLFEIMEKYNCKKIVFSSTGTVYDFNQVCPYIEDYNTGNTTNPYSTTKLIIENLLRDLSNHKGFQVINLRYFNPIGAHKSGLIGENPNGIPNNLLPFVMKVAIGDLKEVKVFGNDYETRDGTGERDYIHVVDLVEGHIDSLKLFNNYKNGFFDSFNLGTGKATSVLEIINLTKEITSIDIKYSFNKRREGDLPITLCDPRKAFKSFGWKAKRSVKEAIKDSWKFINKSNIII